MRTLYKILIAILVVGFITYYTTSSVKENKTLEGPEVTKPLPQEDITSVEQDALARPTTGVSVYVGKKATEFIATYGEPQRVELSEYDDEWWIYNQSYDTFMMVGVTDGSISQIYVGGSNVDMTPYVLHQPIDELYRSMIIQSEVNVTIDENIYSFSLSEEDLHERLLLAYNDLYVQLYLRTDNATVQGVRFINAETLVAQQPYEMLFMGELVASTPPTSYQQAVIHEAQAKQLTDLTNAIRHDEGLLPLVDEASLAQVAQTHSEEMAQEGYLSNESPTKGDIRKQLETAGISYKTAGSNVAMSYVDPIEAVHGWLNSKSHRKLMLDESFTHIGSGAFLDNYTQIFTEREPEE